MSYRLNMSNAKSDDPIPNGTYDIVAESWQEKRHPDIEGGAKVAMKFRIMNHPLFNDRELSETFTFGAKALWKILQIYKAAGWKEDDVKRPDFVFNPNDLLNRTFTVRIQQEEWQGRWGPKIKAFFMSEDTKQWFMNQQRQNGPQVQPQQQQGAPQQIPPAQTASVETIRPQMPPPPPTQPAPQQAPPPMMPPADAPPQGVPPAPPRRPTPGRF